MLAYVGAILVPIALPRILDILNVIYLEGVIIKDYFYTLYDNFLLNLGCNVPGYLSIQHEMVCFF